MRHAVVYDIGTIMAAIWLARGNIISPRKACEFAEVGDRRKTVSKLVPTVRSLLKNLSLGRDVPQIGLLR